MADGTETAAGGKFSRHGKKEEKYRAANQPPAPFLLFHFFVFLPPSKKDKLFSYPSFFLIFISFTLGFPFFFKGFPKDHQLLFVSFEIKLKRRPS